METVVVVGVKITLYASLGIGKSGFGIAKARDRKVEY